MLAGWLYVYASATGTALIWSTGWLAAYPGRDGAAATTPGSTTARWPAERPPGLPLVTGW